MTRTAHDGHRLTAPRSILEHDSPSLITVPLIILAVPGDRRRLPQRRGVRDREVHRVGSSRCAGEFFPALDHADVQLGRRRCRRSCSCSPAPRQPASSARRSTSASQSPLDGLTQRSRLAARRLHVPRRTSTTSTPCTRTSSSPASTARSPRRRTGSTRTSSTASSTARHDAVARPARGSTATSTRGRRRRGQRHRDGGAERAAAPCDRVQSGKVHQYGALLFGAASRRRARARHRQRRRGSRHGHTSRSTTGCSRVGTFLPLVGVLVMLFIPAGEEELAQADRAPHRRCATLAVGIVHAGQLRLRPGRRRCSSTSTRRGSTSIHTRYTRPRRHHAAAATSCRCSSRCS